MKSKRNTKEKKRLKIIFQNGFVFYRITLERDIIRHWPNPPGKRATNKKPCSFWFFPISPSISPPDQAPIRPLLVSLILAGS